MGTLRIICLSIAVLLAAGHGWAKPKSREPASSKIKKRSSMGVLKVLGTKSTGPPEYQAALDALTTKEPDYRWLKASRAHQDLVKRDPAGPKAAATLANAAACADRAGWHLEATDLWVRLVSRYPDHVDAGHTLWGAASNVSRGREQSLAVGQVLLATGSPEATPQEHRPDDLFDTALRLEMDGKHRLAARKYKRHAAGLKRRPEAARVLLRAAALYRELNDRKREARVLRRLLRRYAKSPDTGPEVVQALYEHAELQRRAGKHRAAARGHRRVVAEFRRRKLAPASEVAEWAARSALYLADGKFQRFQKARIPGRLRTFDGQMKAFLERSIALRDIHRGVNAYGRLRPSLAALCREGGIPWNAGRILDRAGRELRHRQYMKLSPARRELIERIRSGHCYDCYGTDLLLLQVVDPLVQQAKRRDQACTRRAQLLGITTSDVEQARQRLNAQDPTTYPLLRPARVAFSP